MNGNTFSCSEGEGEVEEGTLPFSYFHVVATPINGDFPLSERICFHIGENSK